MVIKVAHASLTYRAVVGASVLSVGACEAALCGASALRLVVVVTPQKASDTIRAVSFLQVLLWEIRIILFHSSHDLFRDRKARGGSSRNTARVND
mmetsp:Transcript_17782/g.32185  ORF Transcript_17782/g.32185 Transcript_17782/m.32185 type:complete len:95 (+) Transcript_17782:420-704(+)